MAMDIFSAFDDHNKVINNWFCIIWSIPLITMSLLLHKMKMFKSNYDALVLMIMKTSYNLVSRSQAKNIGGAMTTVSSMMFFLVYINLMGMVPYVFSLTSHFVINFSIALPIWTSIIVMSASFNIVEFLAHFQPMGSPAPLNPFLSIIELISNIVRPITLAVRLTANLTTGHILMALLGTAFASSSSLLTASIIMLIGMFYFMFEMAVCIIQSYIFSLMSTLYMDEHPQW